MNGEHPPLTRAPTEEQPFAAVPQVLKNLPQWGCYILVPKKRPDPERPWKMRKIPINAATGAYAKANEPNTWRSYEMALAALAQGAVHGQTVHGLTWFFRKDGHTRYTGIDLDECVNPETGEIAAWATEIIQILNSYTEYSPSKHGVKIWVEAALPQSGGQQGCLEMYDHNRAFTVTGWHVPETPYAVEKRQAQVDTLYEKHFGKATRKPQSQEKVTAEDLARVKQVLPSIPADDYHTWLRVGMALHAADAGQAGFVLWVNWSHTCSNLFDLDECREKWESFHADRERKVTIGTIFYLAKEQGPLFPKNGYENAPWPSDEDAPPLRMKEKDPPPEQTEEEENTHNNGNAARNGQAHWEPAFQFNDTGNAKRLVQRHGHELRYCYPWKKWLAWQETHWANDDTGEIARRAKDTARAIATEAPKDTEDDLFKAFLSWSKKTLNQKGINNMIASAQSEPGVAVLPERLDANPWLLNCLNGTLDLQNGTLRASRKEDLITKVAPVQYDATARCPTFLAFLEKIMGEKKPLQEFLQRTIGRCLTGDTSEKILHVLYGGGDNGKTTLLEILHALLGDGYAVRTPTETLLAKKHDAIPNDIARLKGARFVYASEAEQGRYLAESMIKDLTGGDMIPARFLHGEWFEFKPEFKLWLGTNHKPVIRGTDKAIWTRVKLIPFTVTIPEAEQDKKLGAKLKEELSGILNWALEGLQRWQHEGLAVPEEVSAATQNYRKEMDALANFFDEHCVFRAGLTTPSSDLYAAYLRWCEQTKEKALTQNGLAERLKEKGCDNSTRNSVTGRAQWTGIGLRISES